MQVYRITKINEMDIDELLLFSKLELAQGEVASALERNEVDMTGSQWWGNNTGAWMLIGADGAFQGQIEAITLD